VSKYELTKYPPQPYTTLENRLFDWIPRNGKKVGSDYFVQKREELGDWNVANPRKNITTMVQRLLEKIDENGEPFRIAKAEKTTGHHKVEYWLEERPPVRKKRQANGR
jgi:hypothetical protein